MYQSIVAMFSNRSDAERAREALLSEGFPESSINVRAADASTGTTEGEEQPKEETSWLDWFFGSDVPDEHHSTYRTGYESGHTLLTAKADDSRNEYHRVAIIIEQFSPINVNEEGGYSNTLGDYHPSWEDDRDGAEGTTGINTETGSGLGATTSHDAEAATAGAGLTPEPAAVVTEPASTVVLDEPGTATAPAVAPVAAATDDAVLPVAREELRVGRRQVYAAKAYRIRTVVSEVPVAQDISLRDETVTTETRPATGTTAAGDPFEEKVVEVHTMHEEPVVEKVVTGQEEVVVHKDATEHVETVRDTVRESHVVTEAPADLETAGNKPAIPESAVVVEHEPTVEHTVTEQPAVPLADKIVE